MRITRSATSRANPTSWVTTTIVIPSRVRRQLMRVLQLRFGEVPASVVARLESESVEQLESLMDTAIAVNSLAEFMTVLFD
ncbi:DUF4351 domain-containing protein [Nostoc sp. LPT]|uniref:DUF4351 domain-containing protein n=1 Tax=Nostoc sp. LPT TaxID=2815387 RepID=UPI001DF9DD2C|nr:DUF4351 domain-containing protein [Nostoc sp. LPT]MBN4006597.1 DUF4351 domain-containing protein [Nostoc sp. LPT]